MFREHVASGHKARASALFKRQVGLTTGFDRSFGPGKRGPSDQRRVAIFGVPYTLRLP